MNDVVGNTGFNDGITNGPGLSGSSSPIDVLYFHGNTVITKDEPNGCRFTISGLIENDDLILGISICSKNEMFSKSRGRIMSRGRVLSKVLSRNKNKLKRGVSIKDVYSFECSPFKTGDGGFIVDYYKGNEIKVFREFVCKYNHYSKKELMDEFGL